MEVHRFYIGNNIGNNIGNTEARQISIGIDTGETLRGRPSIDSTYGCLPGRAGASLGRLGVAKNFLPMPLEILGMGRSQSFHNR